MYFTNKLSFFKADTLVYVPSKLCSSLAPPPSNYKSHAWNENQYKQCLCTSIYFEPKHVSLGGTQIMTDVSVYYPLLFFRLMCYRGLYSDLSKFLMQTQVKLIVLAYRQKLEPGRKEEPDGHGGQGVDLRQSVTW